MKFYKCLKCGKVFEEMVSSNQSVICCGEKMVILKANITEASIEKHVPVVTINNNVVAITIGEELHPMEDNHYIAFICLETNNGIYKKILNPGDTPFVEFSIKLNEEVINAYAYCNIHGLWRDGE